MMKLYFLLIALLLLNPNSSEAQSDTGRPLLIPYRIGDYWGAADTTGKIVIQPRFKKSGYWEADENLPSLYFVRPGDNAGVINLQDEFVLDTVFNHIHIFSKALCPQIGEKYAIYSIVGKPLIAPSFSYVGEPIPNIIKVYNNAGKSGLLKINENEEIEWLLDTIYHSISVENIKLPCTVRVWPKKGQVFSYHLNEYAELIKAPLSLTELPVYEDQIYEEGYRKIKKNKPLKKKYKKRKKLDKSMLYNVRKIQNDKGWQLVRLRQEGTKNAHDHKVVRKDTFPEIYEELTIERFAGFPVKHGGFYRRTEDEFTPYSWAYFKKNGRVGALNCNGQVVIESKYEDLVLPIVYTDSLLQESEYEKEPSAFMICFKLNGKWGLMNYREEVLISPRFDMIKPITLGRMHKKYYPLHFGFIVKKDGKYGVVSMEEEVIISPEFDNIEPLLYDKISKKTFKNELYNFGFVVEKDGKKGVVIEGELVVPLEMDNISLIETRSRCFLLLEKDGKYGAATKSELVVPLEMDNISLKISMGPGTRAFLLLEKDGLYGYYDKNEYLSPRFNIPFQGFSKFNDYPVVVFYSENKEIIGYGDIKGIMYFKED